MVKLLGAVPKSRAEELVIMDESPLYIMLPQRKNSSQKPLKAQYCHDMMRVCSQLCGVLAYVYILKEICFYQCQVHTDIDSICVISPLYSSALDLI